ncbi:MAG: hypothetical protein PHE55_17505 [Methylococcaceae bacterium]|nr:hypothetical protein [Methylococcaceae bacterium]
MSVTTSVIAVAISMSDLCGRTPDEILSGINVDDDDYVVGFSRNGRVIENLKDIIGLMPFGSDLYLLGESCLLADEHLRRSYETLEMVLREIENNPGIVCTATRDKYVETTAIHIRCVENSQPLEVACIYPQNVRIKDGWVYYFTEDEVLSLLSNAPVAKNPEVPGDDEGEGLEYSFALLMSHLALLRRAISSGMAVVFNRCN